MGRLQIRIIFALYALGALVSVAAGSIEFGLAGRIVNPSGIVSSLVALFLAYNMQKGADWARILLGMISGLGFIVSSIVLIFVARLEFFTLLIVVSAIFLGWCTYAPASTKSYAKIAARISSHLTPAILIDYDVLRN